MVEKEFKVNEFITLKLEGNKTIIYVNGEKFDIIFQGNKEQPQLNENSQSIDEMEQQDRSEDFKRIIISPDEEFLGHCSNLQAWMEHDYDTRLLHRTISFPLLKRLTELGDPSARRVFKEEIALRLKEDSNVLKQYLVSGGYLDYFNPEELKSIETLASLKKLYLSNTGLSHIPKCIENLSSLQELDLGRTKLTSLPESIGNLESLKRIYLNQNTFCIEPNSETLLMIEKLKQKGVYVSPYFLKN